MSYLKILLTNDDGLASPALIPTIKFIEKLGEVRVIVPENQMSWTSKCNSRENRELDYKTHTIDGYTIETIDGFPADCANYGIFDFEPDLVVSGANVGHNVGLHAYLSSGTVGAALEGVIAGIPSVAISVPYFQGQHLVEENFHNTLNTKHPILKKFIDFKPDNFTMLNLNIPLRTDDNHNHRFVATNIDRFCFGQLFEKAENGKIKPRGYLDLTRPKGEIALTDTWAWKKRINSIVALDENAQIIPRDDVVKWLQKHDLQMNISDIS